jgi:hypothetical protein
VVDLQRPVTRVPALVLSRVFVFDAGLASWVLSLKTVRFQDMKAHSYRSLRGKFFNE